MKMNKITTLSTIIFLFLGLNAYLSAELSDSDKLLNRNIEENTPVYDASSFMGNKLYSHEGIYSQDEYVGTNVVGFVTMKLVNPVPLKPEPGSSLSMFFMGYSGKDTKVQVYIKSASFFNLGSNEESFGDPVDLVAGEHVVEGYDKNLKSNYRVVLKISQSTAKIKVVSSGWTAFTTTYQDASVYVVRILKADPVKP